MHASIDLLRSKAQEMLDRRRRENEQKASKSSNSGSSGNEEAEDAFDVANRQHTDLLTVMLESKDENGELAFNDKNCIDNVSERDRCAVSAFRDSTSVVACSSHARLVRSCSMLPCVALCVVWFVRVC